MNIRAITPEVLGTDDTVIEVNRDLLERLRAMAPTSSRKRVRFNSHPGPDAIVQEMIIALAHDTYIPPHRHGGKSESFHLIEGELDIVLFEDDGRIRRVVHMGGPGSGRTIFYRTELSIYHAVIVQSETVLFHETTRGPFVKGESEFAPWAPSSEGPEAEAYAAELRRRIASTPAV